MKIKDLYILVCMIYPTYSWLPLQPGQPHISTTEDEFAMDIDSVLENEDNIINDDVEILQEITFESDEEVFCQIYVDNDFNINRMFLDND